jgi:hypothetical protein
MTQTSTISALSASRAHAGCIGNDRKTTLSGLFHLKQLIFKSRKLAVEMLDLYDSIGIHWCRAKKSIETQTN